MKLVKKLGVLSLLIAFVFSLIIFGESCKKIVVLAAAAGVDNAITDIALTPGSDPTQLNFAWYCGSSTTSSEVQVALKSDMTGSTFPIDKAVKFNGTSTAGNEGHFSNKVTATGFKESTAYVYRLGDGTNWSEVNNYTTRSTSQYSVLVAGDPQIGASGSVASDGAGWVNTMNKATSQFPNASFLLSVGDQVNNGKEVTANTAGSLVNESEYTQYFLPTQFTSLPIAAIPGNHETYGDGHMSHFNVPNMSTTYGTVAASGPVIGTTGGDYYFTYGNTLYMMLNSNNVSEDGHMAFMKSAIAANPNVKWKVVSMHHSIYSSAEHQTDEDIITRRNILPAMFDTLGIDVVLDGHDHCYTRTYQMLGGVAQPTTLDANKAAINPKGTLYMTLNSASGSKYYDLLSPDRNYFEAIKDQLKVPTFSLMSITNNDLTISTYRTDTMAQTDTYTIAKQPTVSYQTHVQSVGWQKSVTNWQEAGTEGKSLRAEALKINLINAPTGASIKYQAHVQGAGWQKLVASNGQEAGTDGKSLRMEAVKISLENMPGYSVQYQAYLQHSGWQNWVSDGVVAGTVGKSLRMEAIRIRIVKN